MKYIGKGDHIIGALTNSLFFNKVTSYNFLDLFKYKSLRKTTIVLIYWWMFRFFMYFGINLALLSMVKSGFYLTLLIASGSIMEVLGSFGISIFSIMQPSWQLSSINAINSASWKRVFWSFLFLVWPWSSFKLTFSAKFCLDLKVSFVFSLSWWYCWC